MAGEQTTPKPPGPLRQAYDDAQATIALLLHAVTTRQPEGGFSVSLERDSKGVTKPTVVVRQCDEFPTFEAVEQAAQAAYDRLRARYPLPSGYAGAEGEPKP